MAREGGADIASAKADVINYAFVITLSTRKHLSLHDDILNAHSSILSHIEPRVTAEIPLDV